MKQIFVHGQVFTGSLPLAEAFSVEDGLIRSVGTSEELLAARDPGDQLIDLAGDFVCPGFIDSHMHLANYGYAMSNCDLALHTDSLASLQAALRDFIADKAIPAGSWVKGRGWNQDYFSDSKTIPTREDLDAVSTRHPICITRCCGHALVVNSCALELLGLDGSQPQPFGGHYDTDEKGRPNGIFRDAAMNLVYSGMPRATKAEIESYILAACRALNDVGVTSCHTDDLLTFEGVPWQTVIEAYQDLERQGLLSVRVYEQSQFTRPEALQGFLDAGFKTGVGSDFFRIGPLKMLGDGSLGARTAYLSRSYADAPGEKGLALFTQEEFDRMVSLAHENGMQIAIHAIGDGILDRILAAYDAAFAACPRPDHRSGIVHLQLTRPEQLQKARELGLHAYLQSIFLDYDSHIVRERAGALADSSYAAKSLKSLGITFSNGTDCPVETPNPLRGIQCAVTRQPLSADLAPYRPEEALTVEEALASYTAASAYASFEEDKKGRLLPGFFADFVRLSQNPFDTAPQHLHEIQAKETWVAGKRV